MQNEIALRTKIGDLVDSFNAIIAELECAHEQISLINQNITKSCPGSFLEYELRLKHGERDIDFRISVKREFWKYALNLCGVSRIIGSSQRLELEAALNNPPAFTVENITATLEKFAANPIDVYARSLRDILKSLRWEYVTNGRLCRFKIQHKFIVDYAVTAAWGGMSWQLAGCSHIAAKRDVINDLDILACNLMGKRREFAFIDQVSGAMAEGKTSFENDFLKVRWFKKGTVHLWIKNPALVDNLNRLLAASGESEIPAAA